jgi:hypothetical protein
MATRTKLATSVRQSVTIPPTLATDARRVAKERHLTESAVRAEAEARQQLRSADLTFVEQIKPQRKNEAGRPGHRRSLKPHASAWGYCGNPCKAPS